MESLSVALGERSYPIHIGPGLIDSSALYAPHLSGGRAAIVTNDVVGALYSSRVKKALEQAGASVVQIMVEDGEQAKRWENVDSICDAMLEARCGRDTLLVALGGGVVGDLAGFVAAVYQRGIPFLQVPTTLLAQVDSSVGGKTAINHARGKNMIGAFHQPRAVIADVAALDTLPDRELRAGLAEVVKHGLALDLEFVDWLEKNVEKLLARRTDALIYAVRRCCELKAGIVAQDEREAGKRALLNFGHTFGHAIEAATGFTAYLHGEAVGLGMLIAAGLSRHLELIDTATADRLRDILAKAGLPTEAPRIGAAKALELMQMDKKVLAGSLRLVLLEKMGRAIVTADYSQAALDATLAEHFG